MAAHFNCAILFDGSLKCWGLNNFGQLGLGDTNNRGDDPNEMGDNLPTVDLGTGRTAVGIYCGQSHACAILDDGSLKCWGRNNFGQLGLGDTNNRGDDPNEMGDNLPTVDLGTGRTATRISLGMHHACAILDDGSFKCWGWNGSGQLALGDKRNRGDDANEMGNYLPTISLGNNLYPIAVSSGSSHSCAFLGHVIYENTRILKCWGDNRDGQLGLGDSIARGNDPNEMGDNLPTVEIGFPVTAVSAGGYHTCAITNYDVVKCWGDNAEGQLGYEDTTDRGNKANQMGSLPNVKLGSQVTVISLGSQHACATLYDGSVKCWGFNGHGELGLGDTENRGDSRYSCTGVWCGNTETKMGQNLPAVNLGTGRAATQISVGQSHTCALLDDGSVKCWGWNVHGGLGLGDTNNRGGSSDDMGDNLPAVDLGISK
jgi:alpha-tubulin suppressor-like RCC1 family protein